MTRTLLQVALLSSLLGTGAFAGTAEADGLPVLGVNVGSSGVIAPIGQDATPRAPAPSTVLTF